MKQLIALARESSLSDFKERIAALTEAKLTALANQLEEEALPEPAGEVRRLLIERYPQNADHWFGYGFNLYYLQRKAEAADNHYRRALERFPDDNDLKVARATNLVWALDRTDEALRLLAEAVEDDPDTGYYRSVYAWCLFLAGQIDDGLEHIRTLIDGADEDDADDNEDEDDADDNEDEDDADDNEDEDDADDNEDEDDEDDDEDDEDGDEDEDEKADRLENNTYLYLFGTAGERPRALRTIGRLLLDGCRQPLAEIGLLLPTARKRRHPASEWLETLDQVILDKKPVTALFGWPDFMKALRPDNFSELDALARAIETHLSSRGRVAAAVALADRGLEVIEDAPIDQDAVDLALETARAFASGEPVSRDEARRTHAELDNAAWEACHEVSEEERSMVKVVWGAINGVFEPEGTVELAVSSYLDADELVTGGALDDSPEIPWIGGLLAQVAVTADGDLGALLDRLREEPTPRWLLRAVERLEPGDEDPPDLKGIGERLLDRRREETARRTARAAKRRAARPPSPFLAPNGIPDELEVRKVGRSPSSSEGRVSVSGDDHYALFEPKAPSPLFAPPESVALGMSADRSRLYSWRVTKQEGRSGIARGHYDWILEVYAWPAKTLEASHTVQERKTIEWYVADHIVVRPAAQGEIVELRGNSEDDVSKTFLLVEADGGIRETSDVNEVSEWGEFLL